MIRKCEKRLRIAEVMGFYLGARQKTRGPELEPEKVHFRIFLESKLLFQKMSADSDRFTIRYGI